MISFTEKFNYKFIDFGLSYKVEKNELPYKGCGTPGYIAPEVFTATKENPYDEKCDIFSLGCVFYKM